MTWCRDSTRILPTKSERESENCRERKRKNSAGPRMGGTTAMAAEKKRKKTKKKGRPSLLDIQKRNLRLQKQQRVLVEFRNPNPKLEYEDDVDFSGRKEEKKMKIELEGGSIGSVNLRKVRIIPLPSLSVLKTETLISSFKTMRASQQDSEPLTPLPDRELLVFILDRLQKKDTYGVFSSPVDPEELPDYHDIIKHPMDFSTIRNNISNGNYANLEQFENDVFLITSNAMQYNTPDTIFFRQARSIQELAKKNFENLRQESDDDSEIEPKITISDGTFTADSRNVCHKMFPNDLLKTGAISENHTMMDLSSRPFQGLRKFSKADSSVNLRFEKREGPSASGGKRALARYCKKDTVLDENHRNTYTLTEMLRCEHQPSILMAFDGQKKQMLPTGLYMEHSYTRSLARFAANFGSVGWEIAATLIKKALPPGTKFGPGWIGEHDDDQSRLTPLNDKINVLGTHASVSSESQSGMIPFSTTATSTTTTTTVNAVSDISSGPTTTIANSQ